MSEKATKSYVVFGDWMTAQDVTESEPQRVADCYNNTIARLRDALWKIKQLEKEIEAKQSYIEFCSGNGLIPHTDISDIPF